MKDNPDFVKEKIDYLESLKLSDMRVDDIRKHLFDSLFVPYHIFPQVSGAKIFRGQISGDKPFDSISRLSYNPNPATKLGRANLINEIVFYSAFSLDNAAIESCQDELRTTGKMDFFITVGEWILNKDIEISVICHSRNAQETGTDLKIAADSIDKMMREGRTEEQYKAFLLESEFYANQFAKPDISCHKDYSFSAICASELLNSDKNICDGICYPSVAYKLKGFNTVYKKDLFDNKSFIFSKAYFIKLHFKNKDEYPEIEKLDETNMFDGDVIKW